MESRESNEETNGEAMPPAIDDVQRVDAQPIDGGPAIAPQGGNAGTTGATGSEGGGFRFESYSTPGGHGSVHVFTTNLGAAGMLRPPTVATWVCLIIAWFFLGSKVPFTVFLGIPFDLAALFLAIVCLSRGGIFTGISVLALGTAGSLVVYLVGLLRFLAMVLTLISQPYALTGQRRKN
ncbi:MAG: hypothetical protein LUC93_10910 [Planctomycetaceae bacterium]|nr:hypothetical protein [Planctomycetaceae bacterium]